MWMPVTVFEMKLAIKNYGLYAWVQLSGHVDRLTVIDKN